MGTGNQLRAASSLTSVKVAGVDLPVADDIKVLGSPSRPAFDVRQTRLGRGAIMQLPCTGDPPHSALLLLLLILLLLIISTQVCKTNQSLQN